MKRLTILLLLVSLLFGCSNDCPNGFCTTEACPFCPDAAVLFFPENNQACEPGEVLSATKATLTLQWQRAKDADHYSLSITDQLSGETQSYDNLLAASHTVTLTRAQAYSWQVTSYNQRANITRSSALHQFYLQGEGVVNYAPFAPTLLTPESGKSIEPGLTTFTWEASDLDGDPLTYTLYVDTVDGKQTPPEAQQNLSETSDTLTLEAGKVYYYRVVASDGKSSASSITRSFRTQ
jgi:hypothetical protein